MKLKPFKKPIFVTRPIFPDLGLVDKKLKEIWLSGQIANKGKQYFALKDKLKNFLKVKNITLCANGTIGLMVALKVLQVKGEVITSPFTFPATIHAITWNSLTPVFCDIEDSSYNIDVSRLEQLITSRTVAILVPHIFGYPCAMAEIERISKKNGLKVIYDAAHAFAVEIGGRGIGNYGDISVFSFHATKLFHTAEGGAITTKSQGLIKQCELFTNFGIAKPEHIICPGINGKMNEIQAALGLLVLPQIKEEMKKRKKLTKIYKEYLGNIKGIKLPKENINFKPNFQYFVIRIKQKEFGLSRDQVFKRLNAFNIFPSKYFYPPASEYPHYKKLQSSRRENLPNAYQISREVLAMPLYGKLRPAEVEKICQILISLKKQR